MSQLQSDKFNVAWFKLAEFVSRKEKERALAIYKLLVHSLPNDALAAQLEGDLLLAFHDEKSLQSYTRAVELYERVEDYPKALAVCEHCITLIPDSLYHLERAIRLYITMGESQKALQQAELLGKMIAIKDEHERCLVFIRDKNLEKQYRVIASQAYIIEMLMHKPCNQNLIEKQLKFVLKAYVEESSKKLNDFLASLEALHEPTYTWATKYIKQQNFDDNDAIKDDTLKDDE